MSRPRSIHGRSPAPPILAPTLRRLVCRRRRAKPSTSFRLPCSASTSSIASSASTPAALHLSTRLPLLLGPLPRWPTTGKSCQRPGFAARHRINVLVTRILVPPSLPQSPHPLHSLDPCHTARRSIRIHPKLRPISARPSSSHPALAAGRLIYPASILIPLFPHSYPPTTPWVTPRGKSRSRAPEATPAGRAPMSPPRPRPLRLLEPPTREAAVVCTARGLAGGADMT